MRPRRSPAPRFTPRTCACRGCCTAASRPDRLKGVRAIVTGADVPGLRVSFVDTPKYPADEPVFAQDKGRYIGDEVGAVAAETAGARAGARGLIRVEYEPLPAVFSVEAALKSGAPLVHEFDYPGKTVWEDWGAQGRAGAQPVARRDNVAARTF